jgi:Domain of unknown function (DUF4352)
MPDGNKLEETGKQMQDIGDQMSSCGGSIIKIGCAGFIVVVIVLIAIALLTSSSHSSTPSSSVTSTPAETTTTEAPAELRIGNTVTLKGQQPGEQVEATVVAYRESVSGGEYDAPQSGMRYVGITLRLKNTGTATYSDSPSNGATILTANGQHGKTANLTGGECSEGFADSVKIVPSEAQEGCIPFEMADGSIPAKVQWTPSSGYGPETAEWSLSSRPAPGEEPTAATFATCEGRRDAAEVRSCVWEHASSAQRARIETCSRDHPNFGKICESAREQPLTAKKEAVIGEQESAEQAKERAGAPAPSNPTRTETSTFFHSPSDNIQCEMTTVEENHESPSAYCQTTHPPRTVAMSKDGSLEQGTEIGTKARPEADLPYGKSESLGPWTCLSLTTGMRCTIADGQGFEISGSGVTELHG